MLHALVRWLSVIVIGLVTFWPELGLMWLAIRHFAEAPFLVFNLACLWAIPLCTALPLTRRQFNIITSAAIAGVYGGCAWLVFAHWLEPTQAAMIVSVIGLAFFVFGWLTISTRLWRWARGIVAVQDADADGAH